VRRLLLRRSAILAGLILGSVCIGSIGYMLIDSYPLFDAIYMAVITVATVGYSEIRPLSHAGRIFNSILILVGASAMLFAVGLMTQTVIELELNKHFQRRRARRMIDKLNNHYIICGLGRVGRNAAAALRRANVPFIILENDEHKVETAMHDDMLAIVGDATLDSTLREVGVLRAAGLIAALGTDADNLFLIISAKTLNPNLRISARVLEEESENKFRRAGADTVLAPYAITGSRLAHAILRPHVVQFLDFANIGLNVGIEQVKVGENSPWVAKSLRELQIRRDVGVIVLAIRRPDGRMLFNPDADALVTGGDHLIAMGSTEQLSKLEHLLEATR
jgi:voltage-gated potassium channel